MKPRPASNGPQPAVRHRRQLSPRARRLRRAEARDPPLPFVARRRRRPCRSAGRCRRSRTPSASSARSPACPRARAAAESTRNEPTTSKSTPSACATPLTKTSNGLGTPGGSSIRVPVLHRLYDAIRRATEVLVLSIACAGALTLAGAALAGNGGLLPVAPHSPNARPDPRRLHLRARLRGDRVRRRRGRAAGASIVRYRRGKRPRDADGLQIHGSTRLEVLWTVVPVLILAAIGGFVFSSCPGSPNAPAASAADSTTITVEGHQFYWMFRYPNGAISVGTMIAPADKVVHENVVSRRRTRSSTAGGCRRSAARSTPSPAGRTTPGSRRRSAPTPAAAPTSAGSSTRR